MKRYVKDYIVQCQKQSKSKLQHDYIQYCTLKRVKLYIFENHHHQHCVLLFWKCCLLFKMT